MAIIKAVKFNAAKILGPGWQGWTIIDGPSVQLTVVDLRKVELKSYIKEGELDISLPERLSRYQINQVHLGVRHFMGLWKNKKLIPKEWKLKTDGNPTNVYFTDTKMFDCYKRLAYICLCYRFGQWDYDWDWASHQWTASDKSAVITIT